MSFVEMIAARLGEWFSSAQVLELVLAELRAHKPIVVIHGNAVVTRYSDVLEVLENDQDFGVTEIYAARMERTTGAFFLGMENTDQYRAESSFARAAVRPDDLARIRGIIARNAEALLGPLRSQGVVDAVGQYSRLLALRLVDEFFGVPGPDTATMARWMRSIFWDIFLNFTDDAAVRSAAAQSSAELRPYLLGLIAERKAAAGADDFLGRLVLIAGTRSPPIDDDGVRRNLGGIVAGAVETTSKAVTHALDQLLRRPDRLAEACRAARDGNDTLVAAYAFEALRFNPHNPIIVRTCHRDTVIAEGTEREHPIAKGTTAYAVTLSAMFDPAVVERPEEFRIDRPPSAYMHFGRGQHTCFGERINQVTIPETIKHLLLLPGLRRAASRGELEYEGPFPDHLFLEFERN